MIGEVMSKEILKYFEIKMEIQLIKICGIKQKQCLDGNLEH